jgi:hypothetical protein
MLIHLPDPGSQSLSLRGRLLAQALRAHLQRRGDTLVAPVPRQTGIRAVQDTATRAALPATPHAPQVATLGLGLPQALRHGPATLLLTQPLCAELETFGGPDAWQAAGTLPLVLQGYSRAILTDRADVADSVGFAPWIPLALADGFPVTATLPALRIGDGAAPRILLLDHGAPRGQADVLRRALADLPCPLRSVSHSSDHATMGAGLVADLHLHLGFGPDRPVAGLSPFDSLLSGAYTLVLPAPGLGAGPALRSLCAARSYGDLAPGLSELETRARAFLGRLGAIRSTGESQNPELARFATQNAAARAEALKRFDAVFDAPPPMAEAA